MGRPRDKRGPANPVHRDRHGPTAVPVVLPHVVMNVAGDGTMTVAVDGTPHAPEPFAPPWRRGDFAVILDRLIDRRHSPVRVEVHETDGAVFTDIITPSTHRHPAPDPEPEGPAPASPALLVLHGDGFVPGEDVAVAVILAHTDAAPDGTARGLLTPDQAAASPTREVVLLGRVSGTLTIGHPAS